MYIIRFWYIISFVNFFISSMYVFKRYFVTNFYIPVWQKEWLYIRYDGKQNLSKILATPMKWNLYLKTHLNELTNPNTMENTHDKNKETRKKYICTLSIPMWISYRHLKCINSHIPTTGKLNNWPCDEVRFSSEEET